MPTYAYRCTECGEALEVVQKFTDDPLTVCPACQGRLRKVFTPVGVVFKGSGFYKTDSRSSSTSKPATAETKSDGKSTAEPAATTSPESKPAKSEPTATKSDTKPATKSDTAA